MKIQNQYKYILTDRFGTIEVAPLGEGDFVVSHEQESDGKYFYTRAFQGKIMFTGAAFQRLKQIEGSVYLCTLQRMQVIRFCGGIESTIFDGFFKLTEGDWDLDKCSVTLKFEKQKPDECFDKNKTVKVNLLQEIPIRKTVKSGTPNGTIEYKTCSQSISNQQGDPYYWCDSGDPYEQNWTLVYYYVHSPDGGWHNFVDNKWAREIIVLGVGETPEPDWVFISGTTWAKKVITINCVLEDDPDTGDGSYSHTKNCDIVGYTGTSTTIDNGMHLTDVLNVFKNKFCPSLTVVSDFFQINPQNPSNTNYVTGLATEVANLILFQKSDVKRPLSNNNASKAEWTFEKLMQSLSFMFNVFYVVENGVFRVEHISWFTRAQGMDLTLPHYAKFVKGMRKYSYDLSDIPKQEVWQYKEQANSGDNGVIDYFNTCAGGNKDATTTYTIEDLMTDISYAINNSESDSSKVDDLGFAMIATKYVVDQYFIISNNRLNSTLFWSQLIPKYHFYNRPVNTGKFEDVDVTFYSTKPFKKGEKISVPIECGEEFNPNNTILTALGTGIVDKAQFNLRTCMVELELKYDVFTGLVNNQAPVFVGSSTLETYKNTHVIFPLNVTDPDGMIVSVKIVENPSNGFIDILSTTQAKFTPNNDFEGYTYFQLAAYDNWSQVSNTAGFAVNVLAENQPPVAGNDSYNVFHDYPFTSSPSIFANDSDYFGFTLITPNVVTSQGVEVSINPDNGVFSYMPPAGFDGNDSFQYTIEDNAGLQSTGTVTLVVGYKNHPIAVTDSYVTMKNTILNVTGVGVGNLKLTANDYTPDGITYTYTCNVENKATAQGGNVQINADGTFIYTPPTDYVGSDSFTYIVNNINGSGTGIANIGVVPTIYVKLMQSDNKSYTKPKQNCDGNLVAAGFYNTRDYTLFFYANVDRTTPIDVDSTWGLKINYRDVYTYSGDCGDGIDNYDDQTTVVSGISHVIYNDFKYYDFDLTCDGNECATSVSTSLLEGGYIII